MIQILGFFGVARVRILPCLRTLGYSLLADIGKHRAFQEIHHSAYSYHSSCVLHRSCVDWYFGFSTQHC